VEDCREVSIERPDSCTIRFTGDDRFTDKMRLSKNVHSNCHGNKWGSFSSSTLRMVSAASQFIHFKTLLFVSIR